MAAANPHPCRWRCPPDGQAKQDERRRDQALLSRRMAGNARQQAAARSAAPARNVIRGQHCSTSIRSEGQEAEPSQSANASRASSGVREHQLPGPPVCSVEEVLCWARVTVSHHRRNVERRIAEGQQPCTGALWRLA